MIRRSPNLHTYTYQIVSVHMSDFVSKYFRFQASEDERQVAPVSRYVDRVRTACIDIDITLYGKLKVLVVRKSFSQFCTRL